MTTNKLARRLTGWRFLVAAVALIAFPLASQVGLNATTPPTISVNDSSSAISAALLSTLTVGIADGPGNATDWAGLFVVGAADPEALQWSYLNGLTTLPATGFSNATVQFTVPATPGNYEIRLYAKG